ncbi:MAG: thioredoxin family protein [Planctomycetia bacterium]|nr:thioredoxin family protein [Planctomycetia bacterium]
MLSQCAVRIAMILFMVCVGFCDATARAEEGPWLTDFEAAKAQAKAAKKLLLVDFTGSDWCPPCMRLKAEVFDGEAFKTAAPEQFVLVELDFPNKKVLSDELKKQNAELAKRYEISGYPTVLLLDVEGNVVSRTGYRPGGSEVYVKHLQDLVSTYEQIAKLKSKLDSVAGLDRAKLLDEIVAGCEKLDAKSAEAEKYGREIVALDSDNKAGLKVKYTYRGLMTDAAKMLAERKAAEARAAYDKAIELSGITEVQKQNAYFEQGGCCFALKDFAGVVKCLEQALAAAPQSDRAASIESTLKRFAPLAAAQSTIAKTQTELENATGVGRAKLLDQLIEAHKVLGPAVRDPKLPAQIEKWSQEIVQLDPENQAGLKAKYDKTPPAAPSNPAQPKAATEK